MLVYFGPRLNIFLIRTSRRFKHLYYYRHYKNYITLYYITIIYNTEQILFNLRFLLFFMLHKPNAMLNITWK